MNMIMTQLGERIVASGSEGSHIRYKEQYDLTFPKLLQRIRNSQAWSDVKDTTLDRDLIWICEDDNILKSEINGLIKSAKFYYDKGE
jgi:hypothetical protein